VYKARAMYNMIYDTVRIFESYCAPDTTIPSIGQGTENQYGNWNLSLVNVDEQNYILYPNPNDGNFTIEQVIMDDKPVEVEIWDVVGRSVYKEQFQFAGAKAKLQMNKVSPGIYLLQLTGGDKQKHRFKFVIK